MGSTERMREAGLVSANRSRFTGWILAWEGGRGGGCQLSPGLGGSGRGWSLSPLLTQQRMMSQSTAGGASVFTAFLQAWESDTR